jgi:hypothetical protein
MRSTNVTNGRRQGTSNTATSPYNLRPDDIFFPAMALLILVIVLIGFAQSYFLAGMVRAKLPNTLVHVHGALFIFWIFFLLIQSALIALGRVKWHMTLGILGIILPPLMVIFGILTLFDSIRRNGTGIPPELFTGRRSDRTVSFRGAHHLGFVDAAP